MFWVPLNRIMEKNGENDESQIISKDGKKGDSSYRISKSAKGYSGRLSAFTQPQNPYPPGYNSEPIPERLKKLNSRCSSNNINKVHLKYFCYSKGIYFEGLETIKDLVDHTTSTFEELPSSSFITKKDLEIATFLNK